MEVMSFKVKLHDNPHFYPELPSSKNDFTVKHLSFQNTVKQCERRLHVLVDKHSRIFLRRGDNEKVLGSIWAIENNIVLKGMCMFN